MAGRARRLHPVIASAGTVKEVRACAEHINCYETIVTQINKQLLLGNQSDKRNT